MELGLDGRPVVRQKLSEPGNGMSGDAGEDIFEPDKGVDSSPLAGSHETPQYRRRLSALVAAKEHPIVAADSHTADGALGGVMPTPGLCRVCGLLNLPAVVSMLPDAA